MTYLDAVNKVLRRLREDTVSTVAQSDYSAMIGEFVNDALRSCEQAWDWEALRTTYTINTVAGTYTYSLTGSGQDVTLESILNDTSNCFMRRVEVPWLDAQQKLSTPASSAPVYYAFRGLDGNGDTQIEVYPKPDAVYSIVVNTYTRTGELSADSDTFDIPWQPVVNVAFGMALRERGETGGMSAAEAFAIADRLLGDAISMDAYKHPESTTFYTK